MWLLKRIIGFKIYWATNYYVEEHINKRHLAIVKILDPKLYKHYTISSACMYKTKVLYANINIYIAKIKYINYYLYEKRNINNDWCKYDYHETTLDKFLIDNNGGYSDPISTIAEFKYEYTNYCNHILSLSDSETKHNLRVLTEFSSHLSELTLFFIRYLYVQ